MGELIFEGKTLEEALENASLDLGLDRDKLKYEVIEEGNKGFFKVFSKKYKIKVDYQPEAEIKDKIEKLMEEGIGRIEVNKEESKPKSKSNEFAKDETYDEIIKEVKAFIVDFFKYFEIEVRLDHRISRDKVTILIFTQGNYIETNNFEEFIYSLRYILNKMVSLKFKSNLRLEIDINEYIKKKIVKLKQLAKEISEKVKNEKRSIKLRPMYPNERRIIHITLKNDRLIKTESIGHGERKRIIISPAKH